MKAPEKMTVPELNQAAARIKRQMILAREIERNRIRLHIEEIAMTHGFKARELFKREGARG